MRPDARAGPGRSAEAHALAAGGVETQMLGMLRFLRVLRVGRLVNRLTERWTMDATYVEAAKFLVYVLLTAHLLACLFFLWPVIWIAPLCEAGCGCPPGGAEAPDYAAWLERAQGWAPIHHAADQRRGRQRIAELLRDGADPLLLSRAGEDPLLVALSTDVASGALPECRETTAVLQMAQMPLWHSSRHALYPHRFRRGVAAAMLLQQRLERDAHRRWRHQREEAMHGQRRHTQMQTSAVGGGGGGDSAAAAVGTPPVRPSADPAGPGVAFVPRELWLLAVLPWLPRFSPARRLPPWGGS